MTSPLVSVCIPVYNCERYIREAIQSVLDQTFQDFEIVVVDNASTDRTVEFVRSIDDMRVRILTNPSNLGPCLNWNRSIEESRGMYIKMLGADDLLYPNCLESQVGAFQGPQGDSVALACCPRDVIDSSGNVLIRTHGWRIRGTWRRLPGRAAVRAMARRGRNLIGEPLTAFYRRRDALELQCFSTEIDKKFPFCLDWDLWCRLLQRGDLHITGESLGAFRVNSGSASLSLVDQFARNDRDYIRYLRQNGLADLSWFDCWLGAIGALRDAWLRRLFYAYLGLTRGFCAIR